MSILDLGDMLMKRKSLTDEVQEKLLAMILSGKFPYGALLPSEQILSETFGVSRTTTRSAVGNLVEKGLLERKHGKGIYVANNTSSATIESLRLLMMSDCYSVAELLETRKILEPQNAYYAALRATDDEIKGLSLCVDRMRDLSVQYDIEYTVQDINFHLGIAHASKNKILITFFEAIQPLLSKIISFVVVAGGQLEADYGLHRDILTAIIEHNPDMAYRKMADNMVSSEKTLLKNLSPDISVHELLG